MNVMAGFWEVCIFTTRKNELLKHGTGELRMTEYIEREAAIDAIMKVYVRTAGYKARERVFEAKEAVHRLPVADVAPVVHGRWKPSGGLLECQNCGEIYSTRGGNEGKAWNYCPNCGARMDGDSDAFD